MHFGLILGGRVTLQSSLRHGPLYRIESGIRPTIRQREGNRYSRFDFQADTGEKCGTPSRRAAKDAFLTPFADSGTGWRLAPAYHPVEGLDLDFSSAEQDGGDRTGDPPDEPQ